MNRHAPQLTCTRLVLGAGQKRRKWLRCHSPCLPATSNPAQGEPVEHGGLRVVCLRAVVRTCYNHSATPDARVMPLMEKSG
jgi:hypothetical protein